MLFSKQWLRDMTHFESFCLDYEHFCHHLIKSTANKTRKRLMFSNALLSPHMHSYTQKYSLSIYCISEAC